MDCPQCGGTLSTYALRGREASVCEDCGYVGIDAEHRGEARRVESWNDALRRFYRAHGSDADPTVEVRPPLARPGGDSADESWDDALRRFYARQPTSGGAKESEDGTTDVGGTGTEAARGDAGDDAASDEATPDRTDAEKERRAESEPSGRDGDRTASRPESQSSAGDS
jgi:DNA-directed RNA polymerase subunit M/transcription elongation factor TFIIS